MEEKSPEPTAPKAAKAQPPPKAESVVAKPATDATEKLTPAEWATKTKRVRVPKTGVAMSWSMNGMPVPESPFKGDHRAAARMHAWNDYPEFKLSRADYESAIKATKTMATHDPAKPGVRAL